jgi:hypothetical protein
MSMPGFDAEASLRPIMGTYRNRAVSGRLGAGEVLPMQEFRASPILSQNLNVGLLGSVWPTTRCCKYSRFAGAVVCSTRVHSPLEQCECVFPECPPEFQNCSNFPDLPFVKCRPPVLSQG